MKTLQLVWNTEEEEDRWLDHTCATQFEELTSRFERALSSLVVEEGNCTRDISLPSSSSTTFLLSKQANMFANGEDEGFSNQCDSRIQPYALWFGLKEEWIISLQCLMKDENARGGDEEELAQLAFNSLALAMANTRLPIACVYNSWENNYCLARVKQATVVMESTSVQYAGIKLEDVQRMFRQRFPAQNGTLVRICARLTWNIPLLASSTGRNESLLMGLVCSAVFPLALGGGKVFENELFSTLRAELAPEWQVLCVWNSKRLVEEEEDGGPGYYAGTDERLLRPITLGLEVLKQVLVGSEEEKDVVRGEELDEIACSVAEDAFIARGAHASPFTQLALNICHWLGSSLGASPHKPSKIVSRCWFHFCRLLRAKFERNEELGSLGNAVLEPDLSKGVVHQKVSLVQFCQQQQQRGGDGEEDNSVKDEEGRKRALDFKLRGSGEQAWEPVVQPYSVWSSHLDDDEALRQEMLNAQLGNEMQAFKFANKTADFVDFLQWYSPKDVDSQSEDGVSARMRTTSVWRDLWDSALPKPAHAQRVNFDPAIVGEKTLHWLESRLTLQALVENLAGEITVQFEEAKSKRREALEEESRVRLPECLRHALVDGDGAACKVLDVEAREFLVDLVRARLDADRREYLLLGGGRSEGIRLYVAASGSGDAVRIASVGGA